MRLPRPKNRAQKIVLGIGALFFLYLVAVAQHRSLHRRSILDDVSDDHPDVFDKLEAQAGEGSRLSLQDFHRIEIRQGKLSWEVRAKDASYYANDQVTHVNAAFMKIYRSGGSAFTIRSNAARLYLKSQSIDRAELEGDVTFEVNRSTVKTELAVYDNDERNISAPGTVKILGEGFEVEGVGLDMSVDEQAVELDEAVRSRFEPDAKPPKLDLSAKKL